MSSNQCQIWFVGLKQKLCKFVYYTFLTKQKHLIIYVRLVFEFKISIIYQAYMDSSTKI